MNTVDVFKNIVLPGLTIAGTVWQVVVTRSIQREIAFTDKRVETHQEAIRRPRIRQHLQKNDPTFADIVNEMMEWISTTKCICRLRRLRRSWASTSG